MSFVNVKVPSGGHMKNRDPFVGSRVPNEIKSLVKALHQLKTPDVDFFRKVLQVNVLYYEGKVVSPKLYQDLKTDKVNEETLGFIFTGLHKLLKLALRLPLHSLKQELFVEDLKELRIPEAYIPDLCSAVFGNRRDKMLTNSLHNQPHHPSLDKLRWSVDVGISTSALNRVLEPTITMEMALSDGNVQRFDVPVSQFHQLRYSVAHVIKEMEDLEKRAILKIQD